MPAALPLRLPRLVSLHNLPTLPAIQYKIRLSCFFIGDSDQGTERNSSFDIISAETFRGKNAVWKLPDVEGRFTKWKLFRIIRRKKDAGSLLLRVSVVSFPSNFQIHDQIYLHGAESTAFRSPHQAEKTCIIFLFPRTDRSFAAAENESDQRSKEFPTFGVNGTWSRLTEHGQETCEAVIAARQHSGMTVNSLRDSRRRACDAWKNRCFEKTRIERNPWGRGPELPVQIKPVVQAPNYLGDATRRSELQLLDMSVKFVLERIEGFWPNRVRRSDAAQDNRCRLGTSDTPSLAHPNADIGSRKIRSKSLDNIASGTMQKLDPLDREWSVIVDRVSCASTQGSLFQRVLCSLESQLHLQPAFPSNSLQGQGAEIFHLISLLGCQQKILVHLDASITQRLDNLKIVSQRECQLSERLIGLFATRMRLLRDLKNLYRLTGLRCLRGTKASQSTDHLLTGFNIVNSTWIPISEICRQNSDIGVKNFYPPNNYSITIVKSRTGKPTVSCQSSVPFAGNETEGRNDAHSVTVHRGVEDSVDSANGLQGPCREDLSTGELVKVSLDDASTVAGWMSQVLIKMCRYMGVPVPFQISYKGSFSSIVGRPVVHPRVCPASVLRYSVPIRAASRVAQTMNAPDSPAISESLDGQFSMKEKIHIPQREWSIMESCLKKLSLSQGHTESSVAVEPRTLSSYHFHRVECQESYAYMEELRSCFVRAVDWTLTRRLSESNGLLNSAVENRIAGEPFYGLCPLLQTSPFVTVRRSPRKDDWELQEASAPRLFPRLFMPGGAAYSNGMRAGLLAKQTTVQSGLGVTGDLEGTNGHIRTEVVVKPVPVFSARRGSSVRNWLGVHFLGRSCDSPEYRLSNRFRCQPQNIKWAGCTSAVFGVKLESGKLFLQKYDNRNEFVGAEAKLVGAVNEVYEHLCEGVELQMLRKPLSDPPANVAERKLGQILALVDAVLE